MTELPSVTLSVLATGSRFTLALGANHIRTILTTRRLHNMHHGVPINTAFNHEIFSSEHCTKVEWISRITANCKAVVCTVYYGVNRLYTACPLYKSRYAPTCYRRTTFQIRIYPYWFGQCRRTNPYSTSFHSSRAYQTDLSSTPFIYLYLFSYMQLSARTPFHEYISPCVFVPICSCEFLSVCIPPRV